MVQLCKTIFTSRSGGCSNSSTCRSCFSSHFGSSSGTSWICSTGSGSFCYSGNFNRIIHASNQSQWIGVPKRIVINIGVYDYP